MVALDFVGLLVQYTLYTLYNIHCAPCKIDTAHLVQYTQHTFYNTQCTPYTIHTAYLVQLNLADRLSELGSLPNTQSVIYRTFCPFQGPPTLPHYAVGPGTELHFDALFRGGQIRHTKQTNTPYFDP